MPNSVHWEQLYEQALLELDPVKLEDKVAAAESAVRKRLGELSKNGERSSPRQSFAERHKLEDALFSLRCLRQLLPEDKRPA